MNNDNEFPTFDLLIKFIIRLVLIRIAPHVVVQFFYQFQNSWEHQFLMLIYFHELFVGTSSITLFRDGTVLDLDRVQLGTDLDSYFLYWFRFDSDPSGSNKIQIQTQIQRIQTQIRAFILKMIFFYKKKGTTIIIVYFYLSRYYCYSTREPLFTVFEKTLLLIRIEVCICKYIILIFFRCPFSFINF